MMSATTAAFLCASGAILVSMPNLKLEISYDPGQFTESRARILALRLADEIKDDFCKRERGKEGCHLNEKFALSISIRPDGCTSSFHALSGEDAFGTPLPPKDSRFYSCYFKVGDSEMHAGPATRELPVLQ